MGQGDADNPYEMADGEGDELFDLEHASSRLMQGFQSAGSINEQNRRAHHEECWHDQSFYSPKGGQDEDMLPNKYARYQKETGHRASRQKKSRPNEGSSELLDSAANKKTNFGAPSTSALNLQESHANAVWPRQSMYAPSSSKRHETTGFLQPGLDKSTSGRKDGDDDAWNYDHAFDQYIHADVYEEALCAPSTKNVAIVKNTSTMEDVVPRPRRVKDTNLPPKMQNFFKFQSFNPMQTLMFDKLFNTDENVVVSAPTGAGKTVLFELAMLRLLTGKKKGKAVYLAPTKALCGERLNDWGKHFDPLNCPVLEMTGDSQLHTRQEIEAARLIVATPEKWDSTTRRPGTSDSLLDKVELFMLDEIHSVREKIRGARLEVVVARMKAHAHSMRIVAVSATIPNSNDIAEWIGIRQSAKTNNGDTVSVLQPFIFSERFRPCPLQKIILGYPNPYHEGHHYRFESDLNRSVLQIIQEHSKQRPSLIFCSSRKGTVSLAKHLQQELLHMKAKGLEALCPRPTHATRLHFEDELLSDLSEYGIGFHNAGLDIRDRRRVEQAYREGNLKILCATTTLSVGVNLPAYLVIIRGTKYYTGEWEELSDVTVLQMMGRAGRPSFDKDGVCVIMTTREKREEWGKRVEGKTMIESSLHSDLIEHINTEICVRTRTVGLQHANDVDYRTRGCQQREIEAWLRQTFFFVRMSKNPSHYVLPDCEGLRDADAIIRITVKRILAELADHKLIIDHTKRLPLCGCVITAYGGIMADYSLRFETMLALLNLKQSTPQELIFALSRADEFSGMFIRSGEKTIYESLAQSGEIRYPPARVQSVADKISVLLQASLAGLSVSDAVKRSSGQAAFINPNAELQQIWKIGPMVARAALALAIERNDGQLALTAFELSRCMFGRSWDDTSATLQQITELGPINLGLLRENGVSSMYELAQTDIRDIQKWLNKSPATAKKILQDAKSIPRVQLNVRPTGEILTSRGSTVMRVEVEVWLSNPEKDLTKMRKLNRDERPLTVGVLFFNQNQEAKYCEWQKSTLATIVATVKSPAKKASFIAEVVLNSRDDVVRFVAGVEEIAGTAVVKNITCPRHIFPISNGKLQQNRTPIFVDLWHCNWSPQVSTMLSESVQTPSLPGTITDDSDTDDGKQKISLDMSGRDSAPAQQVSRKGKEKAAREETGPVVAAITRRKATRGAGKRRNFSKQALEADLAALQKRFDHALGTRAVVDESKAKAAARGKPTGTQRMAKRPKLSKQASPEHFTVDDDAMFIVEALCIEEGLNDVARLKADALRRETEYNEDAMARADELRLEEGYAAFVADALRLEEIVSDEAKSMAEVWGKKEQLALFTADATRMHQAFDADVGAQDRVVEEATRLFVDEALCAVDELALLNANVAHTEKAFDADLRAHDRVAMKARRRPMTRSESPEIPLAQERRLRDISFADTLIRLRDESSQKRSESPDIPLALERMFKSASPVEPPEREKSETPDVPLALERRGRSESPDVPLALERRSLKLSSAAISTNLLLIVDAQLAVAFGKTSESDFVGRSEEEYFRKALLRASANCASTWTGLSKAGTTQSISCSGRSSRDIRAGSPVGPQFETKAAVSRSEKRSATTSSRAADRNDQ